MIITIAQLQDILNAGGSLTIDATLFNNNQLKQLATVAAGKNVTITVKNLGSVIPEHMIQIAALAPGQIIFDLTSSPDTKSFNQTL